MFARFRNLLCKPFPSTAEPLFFHLGYAETWLYIIGNEGIDCEEGKHYLARHLAQVRLLHEREGCFPLVKRKGLLPFIGFSWCGVFKILTHPPKCPHYGSLSPTLFLFLTLTEKTVKVIYCLLCSFVTLVIKQWIETQEMSDISSYHELALD